LGAKPIIQNKQTHIKSIKQSIKKHDSNQEHGDGDGGDGEGVGGGDGGDAVRSPRR
jgi:hypothetical protein